MKETLILITGLYRFDNLKLIAKFVNKYYKKWSDVFDIHWIIAKDQYNGFGNMDNAVEYLKTTNIQYEIINAGKPNQKNYGGSLFNEPLKLYTEKHQLKDPWIYILDDDNILHPNLFPTLYNCYKNGYYGGRQMIILNIKFDEGHVKLISRALHNAANENRFCDGMGLIDPSALLMRYSLIQKYGGYTTDSSYDFTWLFKLSDIERKANNILYYHDDKLGLQCAAYHNHLNPIKDNERIDRFKPFGIDNINIEVNLTQISTKNDVETDNYSHWYKEGMVQALDVPIITNETKQKIFDLIYEEINKINEKDEL